MLDTGIPHGIIPNHPGQFSRLRLHPCRRPRRSPPHDATDIETLRSGSGDEGDVGADVAAALLLAGCVERRVVYVHDQAPAPMPPPTATVVAPPPDSAPQAEVAPEVPPPGEVPPPPQTEVVAIAPGPAYVWVGGAWIWHGGWVWAPRALGGSSAPARGVVRGTLGTARPPVGVGGRILALTPV